LLEKQKTDNKLLDIINASVSHEIRNPLNSIIAQNMQNERLLAEVAATLEDERQTTIGLIKEKIKQLQDSSCVEKASALVMKFMLQNFMDHAQIKQGKFRANI